MCPPPSLKYVAGTPSLLGLNLTQLTALKVKEEVKFSYLKMIYSNPWVIYSVLDDLQLL